MTPTRIRRHSSGGDTCAFGSVGHRLRKRRLRRSKWGVSAGWLCQFQVANASGVLPLPGGDHPTGPILQKRSIQVSWWPFARGRLLHGLQILGENGSSWMSIRAPEKDAGPTSLVERNEGTREARRELREALSEYARSILGMSTSNGFFGVRSACIPEVTVSFWTILMTNEWMIRTEWTR